MVALGRSAAFSWPVERFVNSRLSALVPALDQSGLLQLSQRFDRLSGQCRERSFVGLEIDHRPRGAVDCYLSGGEEVFTLLDSGMAPKISSRFRSWLAPLFHLEYDYTEAGYVFAGYTQRCNFDDASTPEILLAIEDFIAQNIDPAAVTALARSGTSALIAQLGGPVHLAVMAGRHRYWLKSVLPLNTLNLARLRAQLVDGRLAHQLAHLWEAWPLLETCVGLLPEQACNLSLDLDLGSAALSERIGLELSIPRSHAARATQQVELLTRMLQPANTSLQGYAQMLALQGAIPYGERQSWNPKTDQHGSDEAPEDQLFVVTSSHMKVCLLPHSRWVKSYIGLCRLLMSHQDGERSGSPAA